MSVLDDYFHTLQHQVITYHCVLLLCPPSFLLLHFRKFCHFLIVGYPLIILVVFGGTSFKCP